MTKALISFIRVENSAGREKNSKEEETEGWMDR